MREKFKSFFKKLKQLIDDPKYERRLLLAALCVTFLTATLILAPIVNAMGVQMRLAAAELSGPVAPLLLVRTDDAASEEGSVDPPAASAAPKQTGEKTVLKASSADKDLYITVYGANGEPVSGEQFSLDVEYPDGQVYTFNTATDGSCYLVKLEPGEYKISMNEHEGYAQAKAISCHVKETLVYEHIDNIQGFLNIKDVTEIPQNEMKTQHVHTAEGETVAEELHSVDNETETAASSYPVLDSNGNQTYTYTFEVGKNGYLLYRYSGEESNVRPIDEDGDGQIDFGQYYYEPPAPQGDTESDASYTGYYVTEPLFNLDNTPVDTYAIYAEPVTVETPIHMGWMELEGNMYYCGSDGRPVTGLKKIDGKLYYFDQFGVRASSVGIDVSYYEGEINWPVVKSQGIDFAIIRVGGRTWADGTIYYDSRTIEYFTEAKKAGIKVGAYFYSTAISPLEAVQEATVVLDVLKGVSMDYPVFYDTEFSGMYPYGRADLLDNAQRTEIIRAFCETILNSSNYSAGVYSGEYFMNNNLDYSNISQYTIWLASYTSNNRLPNFSQRYNIWQFTDTGVIDGINGYVDMDVIF